MLNERNRPADTYRAVPEIHMGDGITRESTASHRRIPYARAAVFAPSGRRTRYLALASCPYCDRVHAHFGGSVAELLAGIRSGCGKPYRLGRLRLDEGRPAA